MFSDGISFNYVMIRCMPQIKTTGYCIFSTKRERERDRGEEGEVLLVINGQKVNIK
jgi:hypothetical protein